MQIRGADTLVERALGVGGENTTIGNVFMPSSTSDTPYFPTGTLLTSPTPSSSGSDPDNVTKVVLEWVFAVAALMVIACMTIWRYTTLRRANRSLQGFIPRPRRPNQHDRTSSASSIPQRRNFPRTTGLPLETVPGPIPLTLSSSLFYPMPSRGAGRRGHQPIRGADTDAGGRRLGPRDPDDLETGNGDGKDELPAYDGFDRPPKYLESGLGSVSHMADIPLQELNRQPSMSDDPVSHATVDHSMSDDTLHESESEEQTVHSPGIPQTPIDQSVRPTSPSPTYNESTTVISHTDSLHDDSHDHNR